LIVALSLAATISYLVPAFIHIRYAFSMWPALALLMAVGIDKVAQKGIPAVLILAVWLIIGSVTGLNTAFFDALPNSRYNIPRKGFMQMVDFLEQHSREQDMLILHTSPPFEEWDSDDIHAYYFHDIAADYRHIELIRPIAFEADEATYMDAVAEELADKPIVWTAIIPELPFTRRRDSFFQQLESTHTFCQQVLDSPEMNLRLYARPLENIIATFGDDAIQVQTLWDKPHIRANTVDVFFGIERSPDLPPDTYSVSVQLLDENGALVANVDYGLSNAPFSCRWSSLENVPAGSYQLALVVYNWQTGARLQADNGDFVVVGRIEV
jgi:hypothetical protein